MPPFLLEFSGMPEDHNEQESHKEKPRVQNLERWQSAH